MRFKKKFIGPMTPEVWGFVPNRGNKTIGITCSDVSFCMKPGKCNCKPGDSTEVIFRGPSKELADGTVLDTVLQCYYCEFRIRVDANDTAGFYREYNKHMYVLWDKTIDLSLLDPVSKMVSVTGPSGTYYTTRAATTEETLRYYDFEGAEPLD